MSKTCKILIGIIIILVIVLGYLIYKVNYFKDGYFQAANTLYEQTKLLEDSGVEIINIDGKKTEIHIKESNKVIID